MSPWSPGRSSVVALEDIDKLLGLVPNQVVVIATERAELELVANGLASLEHGAGETSLSGGTVIHQSSVSTHSNH